MSSLFILKCDRCGHECKSTIEVDEPAVYSSFHEAWEDEPEVCPDCLEGNPVVVSMVV